MSYGTAPVVGSVSGDTSLDVLELAGLAAVSLVSCEVAHYLGRHGHTACGNAKSNAIFSTTCSSNGKFAPLVFRRDGWQIIRSSKSGMNVV